ncbi:MAG TPA: permease-like cell division protein FtsX [Candidatus Paceibacterota bacterium]|nr:permease-like cell division protein FtsX [Candidatus Paceibacterota bacterium]
MQNLRRIIRAGLINFKRSSTVSLAAVLVMTVMLCVFVGLIFLQAVLTYSLDQVKNQVDVTVYFDLDVPESQISNLKKTIDNLSGVATTVYVSAEETLANFKERHKDDYLTLQALEELGENPLGAQINIKANEVSQYEAIANFLEKETVLVKGEASIINKIDYHQNKQVIDRLSALIKNARNLGLLVIGIFVLISAIIVFNTIRLAIYIARDEVKVMRLVGASRRYISGPFIIEGIIYGFLATILTMVIFYPVSFWLGSRMTNFLGLDMYRYYLTNFFEIFLIILVASLVLTIFSSLFAILRYINK